MQCAQREIGSASHAGLARTKTMLVKWHVMRVLPLHMLVMQQPAATNVPHTRFHSLQALCATACQAFMVKGAQNSSRNSAVVGVVQMMASACAMMDLRDWSVRLPLAGLRNATTLQLSVKGSWLTLRDILARTV